MKVLCLTDLPEKHREELRKFEGINLVFEQPKNDLSAHYDAEVILGNIGVKNIPLYKNLKWIQLNSAGANQYCDIGDDIILTNASGAYGTAISEYMVGMTLMTMKKLDKYHQQQKERTYESLGNVATIYGSTVLVIGTGDIGSNYARRMKALGAYVIGLSRTPHEPCEYIDEAYLISELDSLLPRADIVALSVPQTNLTIHLLNESNLPLCKKDATIINVGRGTAIDTEALVKICNEGHFKAVCLDVQEQEPLPADSPLWTARNVYITPHISGRLNTGLTVDIICQIMVNNLRHYLNGEPLENVVNKTNMY